MTNRLNGKVALVTGGTRGIGLASAQAFAQEGAQVFITGRRQAALDAAVKLIGPRAIGVRADSTSMLDLDNLFSQVKQTTGHLDVLFVNAGGGSLLPLGAITEEQFDETFKRNVKAVLFTVQKALPVLVDGSSIILTGSTTGSKGTANFSVYSASKAAVRNFARSWILDLKRRNIRVNVVSPGPTYTMGLAELAGNNKRQQDGLMAYLATQVPMGRVGEPSEIANAVVFLASSDSSFVNGIELFVDGGTAQV